MFDKTTLSESNSIKMLGKEYSKPLDLNDSGRDLLNIDYRAEKLTYMGTIFAFLTVVSDFHS